MTVRRWLGVGLKAALSVSLIVWLLSEIDLAEAAARATDLDPAMAAAALALLVGTVGINTLRWRAALLPLGRTLAPARLFRLVYAGAFFNQVLPSSVGGDAVRIFLGTRAGLGLGPSVNSIVLERIATVLGLVLLVVAVEPLLLARIGDRLGAAAWVFPALAVAGIAGLGLIMVLDRLPVRLHRLRAVRGIANLAADARRLFLSPAGAGRILAWAIVGQMTLAFAVYLLALALGLGDEVGIVDCLALVPPVVLVTTLPISVAGWGVREGAMVAAFGYIGVAPADALVLSLMFGLAVVVSALPGGLTWLADRERPPREQADGA